MSSAIRSAVGRGQTGVWEKAEGKASNTRSPQQGKAPARSPAQLEKAEKAPNKEKAEKTSFDKMVKSIMALLENLTSLITKFLSGLKETPQAESGGASVMQQQPEAPATSTQGSAATTTQAAPAEEGANDAAAPKPGSADTAANTGATSPSQAPGVGAAALPAETPSTQKASEDKEVEAQRSDKTESSQKTASTPLQAFTNEKGEISVMTPDGFTVRAEGRDQAWSIIGPDGYSTRIWGDPHVSESDGDKWDFLEQSTFTFGDNKVTVEVVPAGNGATLSARITIYNGENRVTIDGIEKNDPEIRHFGADGKQHDQQISDGTVYRRDVNTRGESWKKKTDGGKEDTMGH